MKTVMSAVVLLILALNLASEAVQVKEGTFSFSLETVRMLQDLINKNTEKQNPRLKTRSVSNVCIDPTLPTELIPLCKQKDASVSLNRLAALSIDVCEICAYAACTGC